MSGYDDMVTPFVPKENWEGWSEDFIHVREVLPDDELEKLRAENAAMREALTHTMDFCLCDQIRTKGFDYGEDHKRQGKAQPGQRWKTPRECAREALAKYKQIMFETNNKEK